MLIPYRTAATSPWPHGPTNPMSYPTGDLSARVKAKLVRDIADVALDALQDEQAR
jgi:hypothetical protein